MKNLGIQTYVKAKELVTNEKGAMSLEWLGIAALLIMIVAIISSYLGSNGSDITDILGNIIQNIADMVS